MTTDTKSIQQIVTIHAAPEVVYDTLMDAEKHTEFTGSEASIDPEEGGAFSTFNGYSHGKNLELIPGKRIIQTWRADEDAWPSGIESIIQFDLEPEGTHTKLTFTQTGIPVALVASIAKGWFEYYWEPLNAYLVGKNPSLQPVYS